ncbi:PpiC-type peptidyl-prolyl cis-trans isomerase [Pseudomonas knackmussii B13]|uniref:peptidylprolyl isomerase n=2 Tax=Pseudomonas TaxID=286 RepID=A0A024HLF9_PSEKB|nr:MULTISPECIES: peptidylprolyl isomerase [Pseudomonas]CDF85691.1 PpiC-type peptidyl-prolyl cis-trans isomerase [Pseudomonas knackmussii B13]SDI45393.1 peptidyl-prolyl cis-trans isomerase C [Pseudomonas panipatensis]SMP70346.1 peptidyl-prolyl cis-trans isomerase C [Pseudomonas panipatensis]
MEMISLETLPDTPAPVIRVGDTLFSEADIARETPFHPAGSLAEAQLKAARALVVRELLAQRAASLGLAPTSEDDDQALASLLERELKVPEPDDSACRRYFEAHRERFSEPSRVKVRHILLPAAPDDAQARDAHYHLAERLLEELRQHPERFSEMAQRHSACPSRDQGGELGWLASGQTVTELDLALHRLPPGLYERPLASRYGWHVVSIDERLESTPLPFAQVAQRVHHYLREEATRQALRQYLLALEAEIGVEGIHLEDEPEHGVSRT